MQRLKQLWLDWKLERQRQRELNRQLENLTDPTLLDRMAEEA